MLDVAQRFLHVHVQTASSVSKVPSDSSDRDQKSKSNIDDFRRRKGSRQSSGEVSVHLFAIGEPPQTIPVKFGRPMVNELNSMLLRGRPRA